MIIDGNNFISHHLKINKIFLAGKIGVTELNILNYGYTPYLTHEVEDIAGLYPYNNETTNTFKRQMYDALSLVDVIPKWSKILPDFEDNVFKTACPNAFVTLLQHLEPYFFDKPWTDYLKDKTVLVVSPFAESIEKNYPNLDKIWDGKIKPNFKLKTIKYPFALKINPEAQKKWSTSNDIYNEYINIIRNEKFDVCMTGTGYTSLLLAAEAKRMGKTGIHLGGATQVLFGIKGQRWRDNKQFHPFFNKYWSDPLPQEMPEKRDLVEGGCYW